MPKSAKPGHATQSISDAAAKLSTENTSRCHYEWSWANY
jgi:hypothetical protein